MPSPPLFPRPDAINTFDRNGFGIFSMNQIAISRPALCINPEPSRTPDLMVISSNHFASDSKSIGFI
ncbi:MAG: hypothetical protein ACE5D7_02710 [Fidelibacterota bacterium]